MKKELNYEEKCALRLFRLCASPNKIFNDKNSGISLNARDASGIAYRKLLNGLIFKGYVRRLSNNYCEFI